MKAIAIAHVQCTASKLSAQLSAQTSLVTLGAQLSAQSSSCKLQKISCLLSCTICVPTVQDYFAYSIYCCIKTKYLSNEPWGTLKLSPLRQSNRRLKFQKLFTVHNFGDSEPCAVHENVTFHTGPMGDHPSKNGDSDGIYC